MTQRRGGGSIWSRSLEGSHCGVSWCARGETQIIAANAVVFRVWLDDKHAHQNGARLTGKMLLLDPMAFRLLTVSRY